MNFELWKQAAYFASNMSHEHWYQTRSFFDHERQVHIIETPDLPSCRVELPEPPDDEDSDKIASVDRDLMEWRHWEKKVEIIYGYLERGEPLPELTDQVKNDAAIARAKAQSPHYFSIKVEWLEDDEGSQGWMATAALRGTKQHWPLHDYEPEIGRVMAMIGDSYWGALDWLMEDDLWPPILHDIDMTVTGYYDGSQAG